MGIASAIAIAGTILRERIGLNDAEASAAMIKVDIQGVEAVNAHLTGMSKHVSFAASKALNATGKAVAKAAGARLETGPVELSIMLHPRLTLKGKASKTRLDLDNALKVAIDALQGVAYANYNQVQRIVLEYGAPISGGALTVEIKT